jgi:hypothetical protein
MDMAVVAIVLVMSLLAVVLWRQDRAGYAAEPRFSAMPAAPDTPVEADRSDERAEARLAARLFAGDLPAPEYRCAMEALAAQDKARHPMVVPPESCD